MMYEFKSRAPSSGSSQSHIEIAREAGASILTEGKRVLSEEAAALENLGRNLGDSFVNAVSLILGSPGKVIVTGMGKSGAIARKIASTLTSTGTVSVFMDPADAMHGGLGLVSETDVVLCLSNSGETPEITSLLSALGRSGAHVVAITSRQHSSLACNASVVLEIPGRKEACSLNLAPTTSTTAMLALGDAIAVALSKERRFTECDFAAFHPGGALGRKLLLKVLEIMHPLPSQLIFREGWILRRVVEAMCEPMNALGAACVVDRTDGRLLGVITDGDIRRGILANRDFLDLKIDGVMTRDPITVNENQLAADAMALITDGPKRINVIVVTDETGAPTGLLRVQDLFGAIGETVARTGPKGGA